MQRPRRQRGESATAFLDQDGLNALLAEATRLAAHAPPERAELAARTLAVLRILTTTAIRAGALQQATGTDVRAEQAGHRILRYRTKGGQEPYKPLVPYAAAAVDTYLHHRAARAGTAVTELTGPAFASTPYHGSAGGHPLSNGTLAAMLRHVATAAGIPTAAQLVPHSLRHTTATLLAGERSLPEVQDFLDHADPRTTRTYVRAYETLNNSPAYTAAAFIHDAAE